jgi:hypothetical protein
MRSLKRIKYDKLVVGGWYKCKIWDEDDWYFKFFEYDEDGKVVCDECYSPYDDYTVYYNGKRGLLSGNTDIKDIREINYSWLVDNILKGREII